MKGEAMVWGRLGGVALVSVACVGLAEVATAAACGEADVARGCYDYRADGSNLCHCPPPALASAVIAVTGQWRSCASTPPQQRVEAEADMDARAAQLCGPAARATRLSNVVFEETNGCARYTNGFTATAEFRCDAGAPVVARDAGTASGASCVTSADCRPGSLCVSHGSGCERTCQPIF